MADQRRVFGIWLALVEEGFKAAGRALQEKGFDSSRHVIFYHRGPLAV